MKTAVHFGAGAIGRGLLGDLLFESGYRLVIVDTNQQVIDQINETNSFDLIEVDRGNNRKTITNVFAYNSINQEEKVVEEIANAEILTTSVRVENLKWIAPVIAKGLLKRLENQIDPINILAFENAYKASDILRDLILEKDTQVTAEVLEKTARFANTITDRGVMLIEEDGKSVVQVGEDFEAAVEQTALFDPESKPIKDAAYTKNIDLVIDRKLFIINGGHCYCGYLSNIKGYTEIQEGFADEEIYNTVREEMREVASMLSKKYDLAFKELADYVEFALNRYVEAKYVDMVTRVSRNPIRKLGAKDRLVSPGLQAEAMGLPYDNIAKAIAAPFFFDNQDDEESQTIQRFIKENGIEKAITEYTTIQPDTGLYKAVLNHIRAFKGEK